MADDDNGAQVSPAAEVTILNIVYCGNCGLPPEFCEFGTTLPECKAWLKMTDMALYEQVYGSVDEVQDQVAGLSLDGSGSTKAATGTTESADTDAKKPDATDPAAASEQPPPKQQQRKKPQAAPKVVITTIERTKRKRVTVIVGLDKFDIDLKKAAKVFANKFATGASVTKTPQGGDDIVIQGEFADDVASLISATWSHVTDSVIEFGETRSKK